MGPNQMFRVRDIDYYSNLSSVVESTSRETLHDYFQWQLISSSRPALHPSFLSAKLVGSDSNRWRICLDVIDKKLGHLLGAAFIQRFFSPKDRQFADQIMSDMKRVFIERFPGLNWMSPEAKAASTRKGYVVAISHQAEADSISSSSIPKQWIWITKSNCIFGLLSANLKAVCY
jgi:predicted metalloendopeptidase